VPWHVGIARDAKGAPSRDHAAAYARARHYARLKAAGNPEVFRRLVKDARVQNNVEPLVDHPILHLLEDGNPAMTGLALREISQRYLELGGELFWAIERNNQRMPVRLWPIPSYWVYRTPWEQFPYYHVVYNAWQRTLDETDVAWIKHLDPENPYGRGTGIGATLGDEIETHEYATKVAKEFFYNGATPSGIMSLEGASEQGITQAREAWNNNHRGIWNQMRLAWVNFKATFQQLTPKFTDAELIKLLDKERDTIIQTYGVPPEMLGIIENSNRATIAASQTIFAMNVLVPRLEFMRSALHTRIVPEFQTEGLVLDYESPVPSDADHALEVFSAAPSAFTINEWRGLADMPTVEDGDVPYTGEASTPTNPDAVKALRPRSDPPWARALPPHRPAPSAALVVNGAPQSRREGETP
jgi:HK97 family phage portal protein